MSVVEHAHTKETRASVSDIARRLQDVLGQRLVAYATGVKSPKSIGHWTNGTRPSDEAERRLRDLYRAVLVLHEETDETVRAWLLGSNPNLDDQSPIEAVREGNGVAAVRAAEAFTNA